MTRRACQWWWLKFKGLGGCVDVLAPLIRLPFLMLQTCANQLNFITVHSCIIGLQRLAKRGRYCHALLRIQAPHTLLCTSPQQVCHYIQYISGQNICHQLQFQMSSKSIKMLDQLLCSYSLITFYVDTNYGL